MSDRWTALVEHALAAGLTVRCTATGQSMEPAIEDGETIVVEPVDLAALDVGMVVLACAGGRSLVHRVIALERDATGGVAFVKMRGDAVDGDDPPVPPSAVRGRVVAVRRDGEDWRLSRTPGPRSRRRVMAPMALLAAVGLAIMILIVLRER